MLQLSDFIFFRGTKGKRGELINLSNVNRINFKPTYIKIYFNNGDTKNISLDEEQEKVVERLKNTSGAVSLHSDVYEQYKEQQSNISSQFQEREENFNEMMEQYKEYMSKLNEEQQNQYEE